MNDQIDDVIDKNDPTLIELVATPTEFVSTEGTQSVDLDPTNAALDPNKLNSADLAQFRKNVRRLQEKTQIEQMKKVSHFNLGAFFPIGKK